MTKVITATKNPIPVEAAEWDGTHSSAGYIYDWVLGKGGAIRFLEANESEGRAGPELLIETLEGTMTAMPGDYIICGVKGEFYPCKPDVFVQSYDF